MDKFKKEYDYIGECSSDDNLFRVSKDNKYEVYDFEGKEIALCIYTEPDFSEYFK